MTTPTHVPARPEPQRATGDYINWLETESFYGDDTVALYAETARTAVLTISGLPRELRMDVESAMLEAIPSESELYTPGVDPLTAEWCTTWERDREVSDFFAIGCRQVITGSDAEFEALDTALEALFADLPAANVEIRLVD